MRHLPPVLILSFLAPAAAYSAECPVYLSTGDRQSHVLWIESAVDLAGWTPVLEERLAEKNYRLIQVADSYDIPRGALRLDLHAGRNRGNRHHYAVCEIESWGEIRGDLSAAQAVDDFRGKTLEKRASRAMRAVFREFLERLKNSAPCTPDREVTSPTSNP